MKRSQGHCSNVAPLGRAVAPQVGVPPAEELHESGYRPTDRLLLNSWLRTEESLFSGRFTQTGTSVHLLPPLALSGLRNISQIVRNLILPVESPEREQKRQVCV